jgi:hypothetical protein
MPQIHKLIKGRPSILKRPKVRRVKNKHIFGMEMRKRRELGLSEGFENRIPLHGDGASVDDA